MSNFSEISKVREIGSGASVFYQASGVRTGVVTISVSLTDLVDRDLLQKAVDTVFPRFPYHFSKLKFLEDRIVLETLDKPYRVTQITEGREPVLAGDTRADGSLVVVSCWRNVIYFSFNHGLCDGGGLMGFYRSLTYYYALYRYGKSVECPGVILADSPFGSHEFDRPYDLAENYPIKEPLDLPSVPKQLYVPEEELVGPDDPNTVYTVYVKQKDLMKYSKAVDGSPAVLTALFLCRIMDKLHPDAPLPIGVSMPVDIRKILGCPGCVENCFDSIVLPYTDRIKKLSLVEQATCFRGLVFAQSLPEYIIPHYMNQVRRAREVSALPTLKEKIGQYKAGNSMVVSYTGQMDFGTVEQYRKHVFCTLASPGRPMTVEIFTAGDSFSLSLISTMKKDTYYTEFLRELDEAGISHKEATPIRFNVPKRSY